MSSSTTHDRDASTDPEDNVSAGENHDQKKRRTKYNKWDDNADGPDGLSSDERIREFLLSEDGMYAKALVNANLASVNTNLLVGRKRKCGHYSKHGVARECYIYFTEHGVTHRTPEDLRSRMSKWMRQYNKARMQFKSENESMYESEEFKDKIKKIFKYYYDFEQYFKDNVTSVKPTRITTRSMPPPITPTITAATKLAAGPSKLPFLLPKTSVKEVVHSNPPESSNNSGNAKNSKSKAVEQKKDKDGSNDTIYAMLAKTMAAKGDDSSADLNNLLRVQEMSELRYTIESLLKSGADPNGSAIGGLTGCLSAASRRGNRPI